MLCIWFFFLERFDFVDLTVITLMSDYYSCSTALDLFLHISSTSDFNHGQSRQLSYWDPTQKGLARKKIFDWWANIILSSKDF